MVNVTGTALDVHSEFEDDGRLAGLGMLILWSSFDRCMSANRADGSGRELADNIADRTAVAMGPTPHGQRRKGAGNRVRRRRRTTGSRQSAHGDVRATVMDAHVEHVEATTGNVVLGFWPMNRLPEDWSRAPTDRLRKPRTGLDRTMACSPGRVKSWTAVNQ